MLKQRIVTAVVLLAILLPVLFNENPVPFIGLTLIFLSAGAWEWARLNQFSGVVAVLMGVAFGAILAVAWMGWGFTPNDTLWIVSALFWGLSIPIAVWHGPMGWRKLPRELRLIWGFVILALAWLAVGQARGIGINFLLSIFSLVWVADIFGYFVGRAFGKHKLAPNISPGKTWEGALGGWLGVLCLSMVWITVDDKFFSHSPSVYTILNARHPLGFWLIITVLAAASVFGDLMESLVKRSVGFKDSSNLLPGHGGVLDRVDALLPVLPIAMLFVTL